VEGAVNILYTVVRRSGREMEHRGEGYKELVHCLVRYVKGRGKQERLIKNMNIVTEMNIGETSRNEGNDMKIQS
jgi:hypothetical protein